VNTNAGEVEFFLLMKMNLM